MFFFFFFFSRTLTAMMMINNITLVFQTVLWTIWLIEFLNAILNAVLELVDFLQKNLATL